MPTLVLTPNPVAPSKNLRVDGSGFDPWRKVQLAVNGSGWTTNVLRPAADGSFHCGPFAPKSGTARVDARYDGTTTVIASASVTVGVAPVPVPPTPALAWFGQADPWAGIPFGSFPLAQGGANPGETWWIEGDQGGRTISRLYFKDRPAGQNNLVLMGARNLKIDLLDFDGVPEGIYAQDCQDVEIGRIRVGGKGLYGPWDRTDPHKGNVWQVVRSKRFWIHDVKVDQPDTFSIPHGGTEDAMHQGGAPGAWGGDSWDKPYLVERVAMYGGAWSSASGTGFFVGDGASGKYVWLRDVVLYDPGRVGMGTGEEGPYRLERARFFGNGRGVNGIEQRSDRWEFNDVRIGGFRGTPWVGGTILPGYPANWGKRYTLNGVEKAGSPADFATTFSPAELAEMRALTRVTS